MRAIPPLFVLLLVLTPASAEEKFSLDEIADDFPSRGFETEIAFWTKVFTHWGERDIVFHDMRDLGLVYEARRMAKGVRDDDAEARRQRKRLRGERKKFEARLREIARRGLDSPRLGDEHRRLIEAVRERRPRASAKDFRELSGQVRYQRGVKEKFLEGLARSRRYLGRMEEIFRRNGLPPILALMGHVESSFDYNAYSKAGAAGIWQFMRSTGRRYMRINRYIDERRDPLKATEAAVRYMKENFQKLGTWPLTVTAYNHGPYGMMRAKKRHGDDFRDIVDNYQSRTFGFASRNFYPSMLAAIEVDRNYRGYFGEVRFDPPAAFDSVRLENGYHVSHFEKLAALGIDVLRDYNPHITRYVWRRSRVIPAGIDLRVPQGLGPKVEEALASFKPTSSEVTVAADGSLLYTVRRGNTLGWIARSFGTSVRQLQRWNRLANPNRIYAGQLLVVAPPSP